MPVGVKIPAGVTTKFLGRGDVANRRIEPDIEILIVLAGNFEAKVGTVATHVPVTQALVEPGLDKIPHLGLQPPRRAHPLAQKRLIDPEREAIVHRLADRCRSSTHGTERIPEVSWIIGRTAHLANVAVLVRGPAGGIRAGATDEAIRQKTAVLFAVVLRHGACDNMPLLT